MRLDKSQDLPFVGVLALESAQGGSEMSRPASVAMPHATLLTWVGEPVKKPPVSEMAIDRHGG